MKQIYNNQKPIHEVSAVEATTGVASMPVLDEITEGEETSTMKLGGMGNHQKAPLKGPDFSNEVSSDDRKPAAEERKVAAEDRKKSKNQSDGQDFQERPQEMLSAVRNWRITDYELLSEQQLRTLGTTYFQLSNEQVLTDNYGAHTLRALDNLHFYLSDNNLAHTLKELDNIPFAFNALMDMNKGVTIKESFNRQKFKLFSGLAEFQTLGITDYGLSRAQVLSPRFNESILSVMGVLRFEDPAAAGPYLYDTAIHFPEYQIRGIVENQLTLKQVGIGNVDSRFGEDTMQTIEYLRKKQGMDIQEAYNLALDLNLNEYQNKGLNNYHLSLEDVKALNFGDNTLYAMDILKYQHRAVNHREAFEMVKELNVTQVRGMINYRLSRSQVLTPNFGSHTLDAMSKLVADGLGSNYQDAFLVVSGLDKFQTRGITDYTLNRKQVTNPRFSGYIFNAMETLYSGIEENFSARGPSYYYRVIHGHTYGIRRTAKKLKRKIKAFNPFRNILKRKQINNSEELINRENPYEPIKYRRNPLSDTCYYLMNSEGMNREEAENVSENLNIAQIMGMIDFGLRLDQVQQPFFSNDPDIHEIENEKLRILGERSTLFSGLAEFQTRGIIDYGLNITQVIHRDFSARIMDVMEKLRFEDPAAAGPYLYDTAMHLSEHQIRGIALHQLALSQVGIAKVNGIFEQNELVNSLFGANHLEALGRLMASENMDSQEAYQVVLNLKLIQIKGVNDFGLGLSQVQHPIFSNDQGILEKLMTQLLKEVGVEEAELHIPLDQEGQGKIRTIFNSMITLAEMKLATAQIQTAIQNTENEIRSVLLEMVGVASRLFLDAGNQFIVQNSPEQHQETGGDLERGHQEGQESATMPNEIPELVATVEESCRGPAISSGPPIPSNAVSQGDLDLNNTKPNKNHKLKKGHNKP